MERHLKTIIFSLLFNHYIKVFKHLQLISIKKPYFQCPIINGPLNIFLVNNLKNRMLAAFFISRLLKNRYLVQNFQPSKNGLMSEKLQFLKLLRYFVNYKVSEL